MTKNKKNLFQIPNILSISRIFLGIITAFLIIKEYIYPAFVLYVIGASTDALDGFLARKLKKKTSIGGLLDALADRAFIILVILALIYTQKMPILIIILFAIWIIGEGVLGFFIHHKIHKFYMYAIHRNSIRATAVFTFIALGGLIIGFPYNHILFGIIIILAIITSIDYILWIIGKRK